MKMCYDSRQIPSDKRYTSNKKYSDLLYGYLQSISQKDEDSNVRYILKKDCKFSNIAEVLQISRQTVSSKINNLIEMGLLFYNADLKRYELVTIQQDLAALLPQPTVRILCNTLKERSLSILAYLLKTYFQHEQKPCLINIDIMKAQLGLNVQNRGFNNEIITDTLTLLKSLGFIDYNVTKELSVDTGGYRTTYTLLKVNNRIDLDENNDVKIKN